jgi:hypothetical protein
MILLGVSRGPGHAADMDTRAAPRESLRVAKEELGSSRRARWFGQ